MNKKIGMVSLGCPKNQVDAEIMLYRLKEAGYEITGNEGEADLVIVNTCGFIEDAKREAIDNILELGQLKEDGSLKGLIVTGCLAERYKNEVIDEMPEIDALLGIGCNADIVSVVERVLSGEKGIALFAEKEKLDMDSDRILATPRYTAYLRVADGCDNCCTYCTIPSIRGHFRSRTMESVLDEANRLAKRGVRELVVIAQDTTRYGEDIYGKLMLAELLNKLCEIDGIEWIRILYAYPERITDELLDTMASQPKIMKYIDIPIQHCNGEVLRNMNRRGDRRSLTELIAKIRAKMPDVAIRTTLITGFPGETEEQFTELCEFVNEIGFDRLGCFAYSAEEGTPAAEMDNQCEKSVKERRAEVIMNDQLRIISEKNQEKIGKTLDILVEGYDNYIRCCFGRSYADAPEIDAKIFFAPSSPRPSEGDIVKVEIFDTIEYDLLGQQIEE
ncbi:MAG: 30S ribosomal protein S12 methylthiotransferase RimO [Clostridia bacterium]|nr:30S ribosomal protein S12 methylthiotransferase RimO [Clostridia bacterium]